VKVVKKLRIGERRALAALADGTDKTREEKKEERERT
jgi:hypothetical protein